MHTCVRACRERLTASTPLDADNLRRRLTFLAARGGGSCLSELGGVSLGRRRVARFGISRSRTGISPLVRTIKTYPPPIFPQTMDAFGDNFVNEPEVDPAAEFLAREQDQLAGLEDDITPMAVTLAAAAAGQPEDELSGKFGNLKVGPGGDAEGSFEIVDTIGQPGEAQASGEPMPPPPVKEEPEKIKKWREEQKARLEEKDAEEEKKREEWKEAAKKELEEWYKHHAEAINKTKTTNRNAEKQFVAEADEVEPGTEWERIAKLCEFNPKSSRTSKDVSRMRSIILQLKQTPPTPINA
ncbi:PREDICTED: clathrin light chain isoform X2 [Vollenhovia emeryi]|uniref:clathrin light chain isoform X2 n=1 Tax=Vollenhovia emeryi TaxID=411798 RepID=UPI0005F3FF47|nr:PREDICTED: clathrin light chain isoform X2 [Vollenhovia emeryi]